MSYTTRFTPFTSFTIRVEMFFSTSCGSATQSAVIPSSELTAAPRRCTHRYAYRPSRHRHYRQQHANDCQIFVYSPALLISLTTISSHSRSSPSRAGVTSPRMRTASPGPGNGCLCKISSGIPKSRPNFADFIFEQIFSGSISFSFIFSGNPPTL